MSESQSSLLADYRVSIELPVLWGDMDAFGHVNNTIYFRWFESARVEYLHRIALESDRSAAKYGPILASVKCDFRRQVKFPDAMIIAARITRLGRTSMSMAHTVVSRAQNAIVAEGDSTIVVFDYAANKPLAVPAELRAAIAALEGRTFNA
jgi:acyl-CoA thioester hydrolase